MPVGANAIVTYNVDRDLTFTVDAESEKDIHNIFTGNKAIDGFFRRRRGTRRHSRKMRDRKRQARASSLDIRRVTSGEGIKYMTRADFEGTFPERTPDREMSAALKAAVMYLPADANPLTLIPCASAPSASLKLRASSGLNVWASTVVLGNTS